MKEVSKEMRKEIMGLIYDIYPDRDFVISMAILAKEYGITNETIEYIRSHPDIDSNQIANFIMYEDYDGDCKIDREEV